MFLKDAKRVVVIGMGNELRADDAVGIRVVRLLKPCTNSRITVFEGGMTPEAFIPSTCARTPTHLLIIDAAELGEKPGTWRLLSKDELESGLFTTHMIPATEVAKEIQRRCGSNIAFIGIQPKIRDVALSLSREVEHGANEVVTAIRCIMETSTEHSVKQNSKKKK